MRTTILTIAIVAAAASQALGTTINLASVQITNLITTQQTFATGAIIRDAATGTGPTDYWNTIPSVLNAASLQYDYQTPNPNGPGPDFPYAIIDFTVQSNGPVWMLTTDRYGGGGADMDPPDDWQDSLTTVSQLEADGWTLLLAGQVVTETGYNPFGQNDPAADLDWDLWRRDSMAGDSFSIRTEKYEAPIILQGIGVALPEPGALSLLACGCVVLLPALRRLRRPR